MPKKKATKKSRSRQSRAYHAAIRQIAKEDGISQKEARERYKYATVEILVERPKTKTTRRFLEVSPGKFLEVQPGKPFKFEYTFGRVRTVGYVSKTQHLARYWAFVHIMSEEWGWSIAATRRRIKKHLISSKDNLEQYIYEVLGEEIIEYRRQERAKLKRALQFEVRRNF